MKKRTYVLIIFLVIFILAAAAAISYFLMDWGRPAVTVPLHAYLEINLSGELQEIAPPDFFTNVILGIRPLSMNELWMNLRKAKADDRVEAILLRMNLLACDWAKVTELRDAVLDFRKAGKKAYAYIDEAPDFDKEYYLATACDRIILHPMGWLGINGIGGYVPFFKNALDKLGVRAEFEHVEEYKTAYNQFTEKGFTPAHREMMESIYGDLFSQYVKAVASARKKSEAEVRGIIDHAFFQGENALKAGLVDDLLYEDELQNLLQSGGRKLGRITSDAYARVSPASAGIGIGRRVALIYGIGPILSGESLPQSMGGTTVARWIRQARQDKSIAAIVFRVDSPGGSSVASDVIWREVFLAKKEKPFVVSMSDVAGSGGYWISMAAHKIVAQPQTLTGSIGVLAGKFDLSALYEKLGLTSEKIAYGKEADIFSTFRPFSPEEKKIMKDEILWTYDQFLTKVAEGRNMTKDEVNAVGRGRVWTGAQARDLKLVDELGGLTKAVELAKGLAGIAREEEVRLVVWPKKRTFWESLLGRRAQESVLDMRPGLKQAALALRLMERNRIWAVMPFWSGLE
ncbi:MAG: signal peptide peptidase SppA [Candidatus Aminicenantes bacterium]|nr:signal peptide peptidase SppA [Candidatus Aminicenantes bacterium]